VTSGVTLGFPAVYIESTLKDDSIYGISASSHKQPFSKQMHHPEGKLISNQISKTRKLIL